MPPEITTAPLIDVAPGAPMPATHAIPNDPAFAGEAFAGWQAHVDAGRIGTPPPGRSAELEANYRQLDRMLGTARGGKTGGT